MMAGTFLESSFDQVFQDPAYDDKKEKICAVRRWW